MMMKRGLGALGYAVIVTVCTGACSAGLGSLPLPAPSVGRDSYSVSATFANALNLPTHAKVKVDGADVGSVDSMRVQNYSAVVTMRLRSGTVLPGGTTAELRSATPMGDVFIALNRPGNPVPGVGTLRDGSVIPQAATSAAATIEDVLGRAALLVNGGAIRYLAKTINGLGAQVGGRGDSLADLIAQTTTLVNSLAARSDQIKAAVASTDTLTSTLAAQQTTLDEAIGAAGPALQTFGSETGTIIDVVSKLGQIAQQLEKFPSINGTSQRSMITDLNRIADGLNASILAPDTSLNSLNQILRTVGGKVTSSAAAAADAQIAQLAIGAVPDPNFPGDPQARPPDVTDWVNFVGSLAYTLQRLHDRVIGPGR